MKQSALLLLLLFTILGQTYGQESRQIENAAAFTKLYGYVRYFHPSDEAAAVDWNLFAIYGQQKVANCKSSQELQATLTALFSPIAPTVKIYLEDEKVKFDSKELTPANTTGYQTVAWQHVGLGRDGKQGPYKSARTNRSTAYKSSVPPFGLASRTIDAANYKGKKFILTARIKLVDGPGTAHLWARVDKEDKKLGFFNNMSDRPIKSRQWASYEITGTIDSDAATLYVGAFLLGEGELHLDDLSLKIDDNGTWKEVYAENFNTHQKGSVSKNLDAEKSEKVGETTPGYLFTIAQDKQTKNDKWYAIKSVFSGDEKQKPELLFEAYPQVGEYTLKPIGGGLKALVPLALHGTKSQTYPAANKASFTALQDELTAIPEKDLTGTNLYTRLGAITTTWNIFQHFYPYFDVAKTDWDQDLQEALARAYEDQTSLDFQKNLQKLTAKLKDGHISVVWHNTTAYYQPQLVWEWVENKLVITAITDPAIPLVKGDVVTEIDGIPSEAYFQNVHQYISAATPGWLNHRAQIESLLGERGSELKLTVQKADKSTASFQLKRTHTSTYVRATMPKADAIRTLADGVMYINLDLAPQFAIEEAMPQMQRSKAIIFDLRGYPRSNPDLIQYLLPIADTSKQWMQVPQFIYPDQERVVGYQKFNWLMQPKSPRITAKIIFLTDGRAISYAESYMSFIKHYKLATIVGQPTAGTNGNVNPITLPSGYRISWTGMKVVKHDGSPLHGVGILPDVYVEKTIKGVREGRDEFLEKALEIVTKSL